MSTIAEIEVPTTDFALRRTLDAHPDLRIEVERVAAHDHGRVMPLAWIRSPTLGVSDLESALEADPSVDGVRVLDDFDDRILLQMEWIDDVRFVRTMIGSGGTVLSVRGCRDGWSFRVLFADRSVLSATHERARDEGVAMRILNIYRMEDNRHARFGLTEDQHETLLEAFERGYFDVPREETLAEFAADLDISHQALSERLRRAHYNMIENGLVLGPDIAAEIDPDPQ